MLTNTRYHALRYVLVLFIWVGYLALFTEPVQGAVSVDVTVTASPTGGLFAPIGFTATRENDHEVRLDWVNAPIPAVQTYIRAKVGSPPTGITDGVLVYQGAGITADDTSVSLDETAANIYYRAWSLDGVGTPSVNSAQANTGGIGVTLLAFLVTAALFTIAAYVIHNGVLKWIAVGIWFILAGYAYTQHTTTWDVQYLLFWLAIWTAVAISVEYVYGEYRERKTRPVVNIELEQYRNDYQAQRAAYDAFRTDTRPVRRKPHVASTSDEERILKRSTNLFQKKLEEKYGKGTQKKK